MIRHRCHGSLTAKSAGKGCPGPCGSLGGHVERQGDTRYLEQKYTNYGFTVSSCLVGKKQTLTQNKWLSVG